MKPMNEQLRYVAAAQEINELGAALAKVQERIAELEVLMQRGEPNKESSHVAAALEFASTGKVRMPDANPTTWHDEHLVLRQQQDALQKAMATRQAALSEVARELSQEARAEAEGEYKKLAKRQHQLLLQLDAAMQDGEDFLLGLSKCGYDVHFSPSLQWPQVGRVRDNFGSAMYYRVRELRDDFN